jgi:membrane protein implicated in regulation of membrane protease activity
MPTLFWIWMAAALIFLIIELTTPTLIFICFVAGSVVAGIYTYFYPEAYYWQIGIFVVISVILLPLTRRFAKRITKTPPELSNVDRMIGQTAVVVSDIDPDNGGKVRFEGEIWAAVAEEKIEAQAKVEIESVSGTRVKVKRKS